MSIKKPAVDPDIDVPSKGRAGKWAVETITCAACNLRNVHVYLVGLEQIECECRAWMLTALGLRRQRAAERSN